MANMRKALKRFFHPKMNVIVDEEHTTDELSESKPTELNGNYTEANGNFLPIPYTRRESSPDKTYGTRMIAGQLQRPHSYIVDERGRRELEAEQYEQAQRVRRKNTATRRADAKGICESMFFAVQYNDSTMLEDLLRQTHEFINDLNEDGISVLHFAAMAGAHDCIPILDRFGADLNLLDERGQTPVYYAILMKNYKCAKLLIEKGAIHKDSDEFRKIRKRATSWHLTL